MALKDTVNAFRQDPTMYYIIQSRAQLYCKLNTGPLDMKIMFPLKSYFQFCFQKNSPTTLACLFAPKASFIDFAFRPLLLALVLVELQVTLTKNWTEKLLERPSICYIFEKLKVQGCQIWHSHVSIPFNSAAAHSAYPHNAKKALYVIILCEIPEN